MLVRYYVADEPVVLRDATIATRDARCRRIEAATTLSGGLILIVMLVTLLLTSG